MENHDDVNGNGNSDSLDKYPEELPLLALRNMVVFPSGIYPISVEREASINLIDDVVKSDRLLGCLFQKNPEEDSPGFDDVYHVGVVCKVAKLLQMPTGGKHVVLQSLKRFRIKKTLGTIPYFKAEIEIVEDEGEIDISTKALVNSIRQSAINMAGISPNIPDEVGVLIQNIDDEKVLLDMIATNLDITIDKKVELLDEPNIKLRAGQINTYLVHDLEMLELSKKINDQVKGTIDKSQKEFYLREQLKAIQEELGEVDEQSREINELREKITNSGMTDEIRKTADDQLNRLARLNPSSPEYPMIRNHLDLLIDLPWGVYTKDRLDIPKAEKILNQDHYGLEKVKERILEYLSVRKLNENTKGPILCFIGPPGVGKTSLGQSIARAIGRKFVRMSLGGIHDEAEIRGHRRTYIGALPGRIVQGIKKAGSANPLFMLDEIDKVGADFRGDPTSALLEVLDPQQNDTFEDHYLGVPLDLSKVLFICTGNDISSIPAPLLDRMELIRLAGYTEEEKVQIARKYLVPRQIPENGLKKKQVKFNIGALRKIVSSYTREAGVRNLEREIANVCRRVAKKTATGEGEIFTITKDTVSDYLGPESFYRETVDRTKVPGVAVGMAWTPVGGTILFIEAGKMKGHGKLLLTGKLGDTMKESAQAALSYIRSKSQSLGIEDGDYESFDIHIHVPAGAVPKDGPSAGVALFAALLSMFKEKALPNTVSMTGEISLRGLVLPVGGIKEKLIGAKNAGIKTVLLPKRNGKDLDEVPDEIKTKMDIHLIETLDEVVDFFFTTVKAKVK